MNSTFRLFGVFVRFLTALFLVFASYNPSSYSYYHWVVNRGDSSLPLLLIAGIALLIGWIIFLRATMRSLGLLGIILVLALLTCFVWLAIDFNIVSLGSRVFVNLVLVICASVLAIGMSWSHIRRRMSGQTDVDDIDQ
jgi:predicted neutral ceramidase superfamily lipid hydrolase